MSFAALLSVAVNLPYSLREQVLGFAAFVEDSSQELFAAVGVDNASQDQVDRLVYAAGVWRFWQSLNSQVSLLDNSLAVLASNGARNIQLGSSIYNTTSPQYRLLVNLRNELRRILRDQGMEFIYGSKSLPDLVRNVAQYSGR